VFDAASMSELPSWWGYPAACQRGHEWGPGKVIVSWKPCDCQSAKDAGKLGHLSVSCQEPGKLRLAGMTIGMGRAAEAKGQESGIDYMTLLRDLPEMKQAVVNADKNVRHQLRLELRAESDGKAEDIPAVELAVDLAELADELAKEDGPPEPSETAG
jgi:hypothetical protein